MRTLPLPTRRAAFPFGKRPGASVCTPSSPGFLPYPWGRLPRMALAQKSGTTKQMFYWVDKASCFLYSAVGIHRPGLTCPTCLAYGDGTAGQGCHCRPFGSQQSRAQWDVWMQLEGDPTGRRNLISSCLESHFDFAIKMCKCLHQPVVEIGYTSLQTYLDCSLSWFEPTLRGKLFLGKIHRNLSIWRLLERRQERSLF